MSKTFGIVIGALAVVGLALGGIAYASIPDSGGVIHGCYGKSNGQLRVIDESQACKNNETALSWNEQGQQGLPGQDGEDGQPGGTGPAGPSGISHAYHLSSDGGSLDADEFSATLDLPAGHYVVFAKATIAGPGAFIPLLCTLFALPTAQVVDRSIALSSVDGPVFVYPMALEGHLELPSGGSLLFGCGSGEAPNSAVSNVQVDAIAVDAVN